MHGCLRGRHRSPHDGASRHEPSMWTMQFSLDSDATPSKEWPGSAGTFKRSLYERHSSLVQGEARPYRRVRPVLWWNCPFPRMMLWIRPLPMAITLSTEVRALGRWTATSYASGEGYACKGLIRRSEKVYLHGERYEHPTFLC